MPRTIDSVRTLVDFGVPLTDHAEVLVALMDVEEDEAFVGLLERLRATRSSQELAESVIEAKHESLGGDSGVLGPPLGARTVTASVAAFGALPVNLARTSATLAPSRSRTRRVNTLRSSLTARSATEVGLLGTTGRVAGLTADLLVDPRPVPTSSDVMAVSDGVGYHKHYREGSIYWSPTEGAHYVLGQVLFRWYLDGATNGRGYPSTDALVTPKEDGNYNHFTGGTILWTQADGVRQLSGDIELKWIEHGDVEGPLGLPTTDESWVVGGGRFGRFARFQGGSIYSSAATGTHALYGAVERAWCTAGDVDSTLGWPTSSVLQQAPGSPSLFAAFEDGVLHWAFGAEKATAVLPAGTYESVDLSWSHEDLESVLLPGLRGVVQAMNGASVGGGLERGGVSDVSFDGLTSHNRRLSFSGVVRVQWGQGDGPVLSGTLLAAAAGALATGSTHAIPTDVSATARTTYVGRFRSGRPRVDALVHEMSDATPVVGSKASGLGVFQPDVALDLSAAMTALPVDARWSIDWVVEVSWDPSEHAVAAAIVAYSIGAASQADGDAEAFELAQRKLEEHLDGHLWKPWVVASVPRQPDDDPRAVLTALVSSSGQARTYLEPTGSKIGVLTGPTLLVDVGLRGIAKGKHVLDSKGVSGLRVPSTVLARVASSTVGGDDSEREASEAEVETPRTADAATSSRSRRGVGIRRPVRPVDRTRPAPADPR